MIGVIILVILVVVILAAVIAVTAGRRGREGQADGKQDGIRDLKVDAVEMKRKKRIRRWRKPGRSCIST